MRQRLLTAIVSLVIFIPFMIIGGLGFELLVTGIAILTLQELLNMMGKKLNSLEGALAILSMLAILLPSHYFGVLPQEIDQLVLYYASIVVMMFFMICRPERLDFEVLGSLSLAALYVGRGYHFMLETRALGIIPLFYVLMIIWGNDTFAYIVGKNFGKRKLAPKISPNKTIEGSVGGIIGAIVLSSLVLLIFRPLDISIVQNLLLVTFVGLVGQVGDLAESAIKRHYGVKDSGNILPGHGGMLDRFDNMLLTLPMFYFIISFL